MTSQPASTEVAYVESFSSLEVAKNICAVANSQGGQVIVGQSGPSKPRDQPGVGPAVYGVSPSEIGAFRKSLSKHFMTPFPEFEVSYSPSESAQVAVFQVKKHDGRNKIALKDGSIWTRRGDKNETHMARTKSEKGGNEIDEQTNSNQESDDPTSRFNHAILSGKSETIEFVKSVKDPVFAQTISAFANTNGGTIYVGVEELSTGWSQVGTTSREVRRYLDNLSKHFNEPLPVVKHDSLPTDGPRGVGKKDHPIVSVTVPKRSSSEFVSLKDGSAYERSRDKTVRMELEFRELETVIGQSDKANIIQALLSSEPDVMSKGWVEKESDVRSDRISRYLTQLYNDKVIPKLESNRGGDFVTIDSESRLKLASILQTLVSTEDRSKEAKSTSDQPDPEQILSDPSKTFLLANLVERKDDWTTREQLLNSPGVDKKQLDNHLDQLITAGYVTESTNDNSEQGFAIRPNQQEVVANFLDNRFAERKETLRKLFSETKLSKLLIQGLAGFADVSLTASSAQLAAKVVDFVDSWNKLNEVNEIVQDSEKALDKPDTDDDQEVDPDRAQPRQSIGGSTDYQRNSGEDQVCLEADKYSAALAAFFEKAGEKPDNDLCFALFGHWGRGKTYLINKAADILKGKRYSIVNFSAWKYRTTPETWAYLFKQFFDQGRKEDFRLPASAAFKRHGAWPLIVSLFALAFSLYLSHIASDLFWLIQAIGLMTVVFVAFTFLKFFRSGTNVRAKYLFKGHDEQLGLQASIGDDLKALLTAWIRPKQFDYLKSVSFWIKSGLYVAGCALCLAILWRSFSPPDQLPPGFIEYRAFDRQVVKLPLPRDYLMPVNPWAVFVIYTPFVLLCLIGPFLLFWPFWKYRTDRILLVIDDLDRCENDQMLEIIESTMLLLDDQEIKERVQIAMLVEERAIEAALSKKYQHLWSEIEDEEEQASLKDQILRENIEKIFLAHLRLPYLANSELEELFETFVDVEREDKESEAPDTPPAVGETTVVSGVQPTEGHKPAPEVTTPNAASEPVSAAIQAKVTDIERNIAWTADELEQFKSRIDYLASSSYEGRWGPRAVRRLLTRYQMARAILVSFGHNPNPTELIDALLEKSNDTAEVEFSADKIKYVAQQVS